MGYTDPAGPREPALPLPTPHRGHAPRPPGHRRSRFETGARSASRAEHPPAHRRRALHPLPLLTRRDQPAARRARPSRCLAASNFLNWTYLTVPDPHTPRRIRYRSGRAAVFSPQTRELPVVLDSGAYRALIAGTAPPYTRDLALYYGAIELVRPNAYAAPDHPYGQAQNRAPGGDHLHVSAARRRWTPLARLPPRRVADRAPAGPVASPPSALAAASLSGRAHPAQPHPAAVYAHAVGGVGAARLRVRRRGRGRP